MDSQRLVSHDDIAAAYPAVRNVVHHTPLTTCSSVTERCGLPTGSLLFKLENVQRTGSFKIRGAYHRLSQLTASQKAAGVVAVDRPGGLAALLELVAELKGNIIMLDGLEVPRCTACGHVSLRDTNVAPTRREN